jgi:hypothetical protein
MVSACPFCSLAPIDFLKKMLGKRRELLESPGLGTAVGA